MSKEELLTKFNRVSNDPRQAQSFVKEMLESISNIDATSLPQIDIDNATSDKLKSVYGKCFYEINNQQVFYPGMCNEEQCYYFSIYVADDGLGNGTLMVVILTKDDEDITAESYYYDISELRETKLYKHKISWQGDNGGCQFISTSATPITENMTFVNFLSLLKYQTINVNWYHDEANIGVALSSPSIREDELEISGTFINGQHEAAAIGFKYSGSASSTLEDYFDHVIDTVTAL